ncbi:hypothetical protein SERLADRAFT_443380 [Serpula lacrymans var. lacrymans S7.9]|uniref:Uncharacterized protein n=1 Tax=Serpula lacrymans var. lacrymans (strain S7.9) TaxID=578457 RepID=F8PCC9_SERL9|nr:uncharacterized protein SERLADRAFT_443380 [Serpula lacrymans var. lacrymans S7.9]EGO19327.1 hypothetical protein SERLADRAFT_443380 [Serpula lacrymans var. lacrymans S7.9]
MEELIDLGLLLKASIDKIHTNRRRIEILAEEIIETVHELQNVANQTTDILGLTIPHSNSRSTSGSLEEEIRANKSRVATGISLKELNLVIEQLQYQFEEAVQFYKEFAVEKITRCTVSYAHTLYNFSSCLSKLGRDKEALMTTTRTYSFAA